MNKQFVICVIDDDEIYQFTATKFLERNRLTKRIIVFSDGEEALEFFTDNISNLELLPDVVFLDINMPIMDGFQFIEEYVKLKPRVGKRITIYMVSSSVDPVDIERANAISEISDYLIKPITPDKLDFLLETIQIN